MDEVSPGIQMVEGESVEGIKQKKWDAAVQGVLRINLELLNNGDEPKR